MARLDVDPALVTDLLVPQTGTNQIPQVRLPDGTFVEDTSEIIDVLEALHPSSSAIPEGPRQRLVAYLVEFLADEWMNAYAFVRATAPAFAQTACLASDGAGSAAGSTSGGLPASPSPTAPPPTAPGTPSASAPSTARWAPRATNASQPASISWTGAQMRPRLCGSLLL